MSACTSTGPLLAHVQPSFSLHLQYIWSPFNQTHGALPPCCPLIPNKATLLSTIRHTTSSLFLFSWLQLSPKTFLNMAKPKTARWNKSDRHVFHKTQRNQSDTSFLSRYQTPWHLPPHHSYHKKTMYTDETGCFPLTSWQPHGGCELNDNYINADCLKSRKTRDLVNVYQYILQQWKASHVYHVNLHVFDNEPPGKKAAICDNEWIVKLTHPIIHWYNYVERAIGTFEGHLISILANVNTFSHLQLGCTHLANHPHPWSSSPVQHCPVAPKIFAYANNHSPFDVDRMLLALIRCTVNFMWKWIAFAHGVNISWMAGTLVHPLNTIALTLHLSRILAAVASLTTFSSNKKYITQPTITTADAIVDALI